MFRNLAHKKTNEHEMGKQTEREGEDEVKRGMRGHYVFLNLNYQC